MNKIIYLDAAATALKPPSVVDAEMDFLSHRYANAGRGVCARAAAADAMVAATRRTVADFMGANPNQIAFVSGATDGLNRAIAMVNASFGEKNIARRCRIWTTTARACRLNTWGRVGHAIL